MNYLLFDVGSTYTKACIVDVAQAKILKTTKAFTTSTTDISEGIEKAKEQMKDVLDNIKIDQTLLCSSAGGGLRMIASGLVKDLTAKAAINACLSAGAKVIKSYAYELNQNEIDEIEKLQCDIFLLCGGTDGGNSEVVIKNAQKIAKIKQNFPILYAGNKSCRDEIVAIFNQEQRECIVCDNVMPTLGVMDVIDCKAKIQEIFLRQIIKAKGLTHVASVMDDIILPTPASVLEALKLLSYGTKHEKGIGNILAVDIGGATSDVYSITDQIVTKPNVILKGLVEEKAKRSVEGDLGVRFNAQSVYELSKDSFFDICQLEAEKALNIIENMSRNVHVELSEDVLKVDEAVACWCTYYALRRHSGVMEMIYTSNGPGFVQNGKDLSEIKTIIGIGGPIINSKDPKKILSFAKKQAQDIHLLLPETLEYKMDKTYIISCLGLIANKHSDAVLKIMKEMIEEI